MFGESGDFLPNVPKSVPEKMFKKVVTFFSSRKTRTAEQMFEKRGDFFQPQKAYRVTNVSKSGDIFQQPSKTASMGACWGFFYRYEYILKNTVETEGHQYYGESCCFLVGIVP